ncbi:MAG: carboxypeptidase-like regulatory domain-containing protein [Bacteroides sp.]|nr:carboxypeptidase-like regulatory domain-containing protein [Bacteroides sp.]
MKKLQKISLALLILFCSFPVYSQQKIQISGKIISTEDEIISFATTYLKGTSYGSTTNSNGVYNFEAPAGNYTLIVSAIGFKTVEKFVKIAPDKKNVFDIVITPEIAQLDEVVVLANGVTRVKRSPYNAVAIDAKSMHNSTTDLASSLVKVPGIKLRESGGVGSDMQFMMDGFSGKHIKIFIDGVPQEGVGSSFGLNNIPINFAERIEVYKGVVPVGFGTDALAGVINVVTNKNKRRWFLDASYSYGSFNTHKSYVNFGQTFKSGFTYEINAFQNYSDNNYRVDVLVEEFKENGVSQMTKVPESVKRFNDTYHNEAIVGKIGIVGKKWADRLMLGFTYSQYYKEIQTGVRQDVVFGGKHRKGHSLMPSVEYRKRDLFTKGLDVALTANYNKNMNRNIDTTSYKFNWRGEKIRMKAPGEQSYQDTRSDNDNWNGTFTANYRFARIHTLTFNHVITYSERKNTNKLVTSEADAISKESRKNISGLSYRLVPSEKWNLSVFGKYYDQFNAGPLATSESSGDYIRATNSTNTFGYGIAGTYYILKPLQAKLSYEKAYRLPTTDEVFGDEDLELGTISLRPEKSDNYNLNLSYNQQFGNHVVYLEGGIIYRNTTDYIQRRTSGYSGGKYYASYENHGKVETKGFNIAANYSYSKWISIGANLTKTDVRDNVKTVEGGSNQENQVYGARMPNIPYLFANSDLAFFWHDCGKKGNTLTFTYDNLYLHSFPLYSERLGDPDSKFNVPSQFSHNIGLAYSMKNGRYNISFECRNFTDEKLYDNFSLQRAGRAFYGKVRIYFGSR